MEAVEPFSLKGAHSLTAWVNSVLGEERTITSLGEFKEADNFLLFVEALSGTTELGKRNKKPAINIQTATQFLGKHLLYDWGKAKDNVLSGNESLISSLIFTLALHYVIIPWVVSRSGNPQNWKNVVEDAFAVVAAQQAGSHRSNHLDSAAWCAVVLAHCEEASFSAEDVEKHANAPALQFKLVVDEMHAKFRVPKMLKPHELSTLDSRLISLYIILCFRALKIDANSTKTSRLDRVHVLTSSTGLDGQVSFSSKRRPKKPLPSTPQEDMPSELEDIDISQLVPPGITLLPSNRYCVAMTEELATPAQRAQMDIFPGDFIKIEQSFVTGWMRGSVLGTDRYGIFPSHAIEEVLVSEHSDGKKDRNKVVSVSARRGWKPPAAASLWQRAAVSPMPQRRRVEPEPEPEPGEHSEEAEMDLHLQEADLYDDDVDETTMSIIPPVIEAPAAPKPWTRRGSLTGGIDRCRTYDELYQILVVDNDDSLFDDLKTRCSLKIDDKARASLIEDDLKLLSVSVERVHSVLLSLIELNFVTSDRKKVLVGMYALVDGLLYGLSGIRAPHGDDEQQKFLTIVRNIITVLSQLKLRASRTLEAQKEWIDHQREQRAKELHHKWVQDQHALLQKAALKRRVKLKERQQAQQHEREMQWEGLLQAAQQQKQAEVAKLSIDARLQIEEAERQAGDALLVEVKAAQQVQISRLCSMNTECQTWSSAVPVLVTLLNKISSPHFLRLQQSAAQPLTATVDAVKKAVRLTNVSKGTEDAMLSLFYKELVPVRTRLAAFLARDSSKNWTEVDVTFCALCVCIRQQLVNALAVSGRGGDVIFTQQTDIVKERFSCVTLSPEVAPLGVKLQTILDGAAVLGTYSDDYTQRELALRSAHTINAFLKYSALSDEIHMQDYNAVVNEAHESFEVTFLRLKNFMYAAKERRTSVKALNASIDAIAAQVFRLQLAVQKGDELHRPGAAPGHLRDFASRLAGHYRSISAVLSAHSTPAELDHRGAVAGVAELLEGVRSQVGLLSASESRTAVMGLTQRIALAALYVLRSVEELTDEDTACFELFQSLVAFFRNQMKQALTLSLKILKKEILQTEQQKSASETASWEDLQHKMLKSPRSKHAAQLKLLRGQMEAPFEFALSEHSKSRVSLAHAREGKAWIARIREATKSVALQLKRPEEDKQALCSSVSALVVLARTTAISMTRDVSRSRGVMQCGAELCAAALELLAQIDSAAGVSRVAQAIKALLAVATEAVSLESNM